MKKESIFGIVIAVVILLAAAIVITCFYSDVTRSSDNQTSVDKLRIGYLPGNGQALIFIAQEEGYFVEDGLDIELFAFQNSPEGTNAILANKIDVGGFGLSPLVYAAKGASLSVIGGLMGEGSGIIVNPEDADQYKSLADYKGKTIATVRMASGDIHYRGAFADAGLDLGKDINILEVESPGAVLEVVKTGKADLGIGWPLYLEMAQNQGLEVISYSADYYPKHPCCRIAVMRESIDEKRDSYVKMLKSLIKSYKFYKTNFDEAVDDVSKYIKVDENLLYEAMESSHIYLSPDPNKQGVLESYSVLKSIGYVETSVDMNDHIDVTIYEQALNELLEEYPDDQYYMSMKDDFDILDN